VGLGVDSGGGLPRGGRGDVQAVESGETAERDGGHRRRGEGMANGSHGGVLGRAAGEPAMRLTRGNTTQAAYWTPAQLVAHHTVNGCNLQPGDLLGSGTLSGPRPDEAGSLLELTQGGKAPITLPNGERRTFLEDGDTLTLRGYCERDGAVRIGLGEVSGTITGA